MKTHLSKLLLAAIVSAGLAGAAFAADEPAPAADKAAPAADAAEKSDAAPAAAPAGGKMTPMQRIEATEKGKLKNPFDWKDPAIAAEGHKVYMGLSCNGCHGGGGGGGMCPPLTNETWVYGGDDDTLFRLIVLGSQDLQKQGYARKGQEGVVGPMPPYKDLVDDEDKVWKAIAWIRTVWKGREEKINW